MPIQAGSITRMSSESSRAAIERARVVAPRSPAAHRVRVTAAPSGSGQRDFFKRQRRDSSAAGLSDGRPTRRACPTGRCATPRAEHASSTGVGPQARAHRVARSASGSCRGRRPRPEQALSAMRGNDLNAPLLGTWPSRVGWSLSHAASLVRGPSQRLGHRPRRAAVRRRDSRPERLPGPTPWHCVVAGSSPTRAEVAERVHDHVRPRRVAAPAARAGRQRSDASTGAGRRSSASRWFASSAVSGAGCASTLSTEPSTRVRPVGGQTSVPDSRPAGTALEVFERVVCLAR